ncbi:MAG: hypothetical protein M3O20_15105, partial [Acidobacteriota bacterium]|nr:hypothetical protein [Acidobacteriota bacterium]
MLIPAIRLTPYLEKLFQQLSPAPSSDHGATVEVQYPSGKRWRFMSPADVQILADEQQVHGTGSASKLKYVKLDVAPEVAEETLERVKTRATHSQVRERLINPQSSQTVWNQPIDGKLAPFKAFRHVRNNGFGMK